MVLAHFTTSEGNFTVRLFDEETPNTVANFTGLAEGTQGVDRSPDRARRSRQPYYNGTIFHRVIDGFMIQGGDPLGQGTGGPATSSPTNSTRQLRHGKAGILSMANSRSEHQRRPVLHHARARRRGSTTSTACSAR